MKAIVAYTAMVVALCSCRMTSSHGLISEELAVSPNFTAGLILSKDEATGQWWQHDISKISDAPPAYKFNEKQEDEYDVVFALIDRDRYIAQITNREKKIFYNIYQIKDGEATEVHYKESDMSACLSKKGIDNVYSDKVGDDNIKIIGSPAAKKFVAAIKECASNGGYLMKNASYIEKRKYFDRN
ncbi:hypothetical protein [Azospirillum isscasi]|uniref:Lipoprotein n=1 Tax=Azospirillum isscasi TaxID=3053926 RepID=A0ABU0WT35_9PROT|nr:hypothetical protein [Azospirillum isscasi]MDQ2106699.1 hypothetical protein [Azospirillum isscasi]